MNPIKEMLRHCEIDLHHASGPKKLCTWLLLVFSAHAGAQGATFTVNSTNDLPDASPWDGICAAADGTCTLRAAVMQANSELDADTIILPAGTFVLTRPNTDNDQIGTDGDLDVLNNVEVNGAGREVTVIDGNGAVTQDRVFHVLDLGFTARDLTIRNGAAPVGGGILLDQLGVWVRLINVIVENNVAQNGGGIMAIGFSPYSELQIYDSIVRSNVLYTSTTSGYGGGIYVDKNLTLQSSEVYGNTGSFGGGLAIYAAGDAFFIEGTRIESNTAAYLGGGIFHQRSGSFSQTLKIFNSSIHQNSAGDKGGGIHTTTGTTNIISNSTIFGNSARGISGGGGGGGIFNQGGNVRVLHSTISGNSAGGRTSASGGGLFHQSGYTKLTNSTIAFNTASMGSGGGIQNSSSSNTVSAINTIISDNVAQLGPLGYDVYGNLASEGWNLVGNTKGTILSGTTFGCKLDVSPLLGPLQDNGGPTLTHSLRFDSPAIDAGVSSGIATDQRGFLRPIDKASTANGQGGDSSDIGAFELGSPHLQIEKTGNAAVLSWPSYYGPYTVQSVTHLNPTNVWAAVPATPVNIGDRYVLTNSPLVGSKFYRLFEP